MLPTATKRQKIAFRLHIRGPKTYEGPFVPSNLFYALMRIPDGLNEA